ncbi:hypothetical protein BCR43DRAFT_522492 [Syncephalastrum racemosum]|uniref:F-box domain-containing protein n=1 Tax=Syncephalastrum racemosum TaxID=13706 RepID=A0A1X2HS25_SYNRA|nr:hypothetical protein BCR43DRAFT_522492 [Syncephalastrum racemosum]
MNTQLIPARGDWVMSLPYELITLIFANVPFEDRVRCMRVTKSWRAFLLQWKGMWHTTEFVSANDSSAKYFAWWDTCVDWLIRAESSQVRDLHVVTGSMMVWTLMAHALDAKQCASLKKLSLRAVVSSRHERGRVVTPSDGWLDAVRTCAGTLTQLQLMGNDLRLTSRQLSTVLSLCKQLARFVYRSQQTDQAQIPHLILSRDVPDQLLLTDIGWSGECPLPYTTLLPKCRQLKRLTVAEERHTRPQIENLVSLLSQSRAPALQSFRLGEAPYYFCPATPEKLPAALDKIGLRYLEFNCTPIEADDDDDINDEGEPIWQHRVIAHLIQAHQETLTSMKIHSQLCSLTTWDLILQIPFKAPLPLISLDIQFQMYFPKNGSQIEELMRRFFKQCPQLTSFNAQQIPWTHRQLFRVLSSSTSLTHVSLSLSAPDFNVDDDNNGDWPESGLPSSLTYLQMRLLSIDDDFLEHTGVLDKLIEIDIDDCDYSSCSTESLRDFFLRKTPHVSHIRFERHGKLDDTIAAALANMPSVRDVTLKDCRGITNAAVNHLRSLGKEVTVVG